MLFIYLKHPQITSISEVRGEIDEIRDGSLLPILPPSTRECLYTITINLYLTITVFFCPSCHGFWVKLTYAPRWQYAMTEGKKVPNNCHEKSFLNQGKEHDCIVLNRLLDIWIQSNCLARAMWFHVTSPISETSSVDLCNKQGHCHYTDPILTTRFYFILRTTYLFPMTKSHLLRDLLKILTSDIFHVASGRRHIFLKDTLY